MLSNYQGLVDALVRDRESVTTDAGRDGAIAHAVLRYSQDRPIQRVKDVTIADPHYIQLPADWMADFSKAVEIEYPIGELPPARLAGEDWSEYNTPAGPVLLVNIGLSAGATARLTYTLPHTLDEVTDTIPAIHQDPVASYAAGLLCRELAAYYSGDSDSTIQADTVDHESQATRFEKRGRELRQRYYEALGVNPKRNTAAGAVVDLDRRPSYGRTPWSKTRRDA